MHHSTSISRTAHSASLSLSLIPLSFSLLALKIKWIHFDRLWIFRLKQIERDSVGYSPWNLPKMISRDRDPVKRDRSIRYDISFDARTYRYCKSHIQQSRIRRHTKTVVDSCLRLDSTTKSRGFWRWLLLSTDARRNRRF